MELVELMLKYNELIAREKKAEQFFDISTIDVVEKWRPQYNELVEQLSHLIKIYEKLTGKEMTEIEVSNGFDCVTESHEALLVTKEVKS